MYYPLYTDKKTGLGATFCSRSQRVEVEGLGVAFRLHSFQITMSTASVSQVLSKLEMLQSHEEHL